MNVLGISAFYHDSAAALVQDGTIVAAAQEERFTRKKNDADFPRRAIAYCLHAGRVPRNGIDAIVFYEKPLTTFSRLLRTYLKVGIRGARSFEQAMPVWFREKLWIPYLIERELREIGFRMPKQLWFTEHHESHAASAFFASPFTSAAILTFDGVGEFATSSIGIGRGNRLDLQEQLYFPDSIGLLYSAFTYFCGFRVNSGEYKLMGLAPYGEPTYVSSIYENLIDVKSDGSFKLNLAYFDFLGGATMTNSRFDELFGGPPRKAGTDFTRRELGYGSLHSDRHRGRPPSNGSTRSLNDGRRGCLPRGRGRIELRREWPATSRGSFQTALDTTCSRRRWRCDRRCPFRLVSNI